MKQNYKNTSKNMGETKKENLLKDYRKEIDSLDKEIIYLFFKRFSIVKKIGEIKEKEKISVLQKNRWEKLLRDNIEKGLEFGISKDFIIDIWNRIHKESLKIEENNIGENC